MKSILHTNRLVGLMLVFLLSALWSLLQAHEHSSFTPGSAKQEVSKVDGFTKYALSAEEVVVGDYEEDFRDDDSSLNRFYSTYKFNYFELVLQDFFTANYTIDFRYLIGTRLFPFHEFL